MVKRLKAVINQTRRKLDAIENGTKVDINFDITCIDKVFINFFFFICFFLTFFWIKLNKYMDIKSHADFFLNTDSVEIAKAITLHDFEVFKAIKVN